MKILLDARMYGLENTGIGRYLVHLIDELQKIDGKNDYFILLRKKYYKSLKLSGKFKKVCADFGIYGFPEQLALPGIIRKLGPDLVHFPHFNVPVFWRGKFIVTVHDMTMHKEGAGATKLSKAEFFLKKIFYKTVFRYAVTNARAVIVPSETVKSEVDGYFHPKEGMVRTIYEGFDKNLWTGKHKLHVLDDEETLPFGKYFVYMGNLYPHKNVRSLVRGLMVLNKFHKNKSGLLIVGARNVFLRTLEDYIFENKMGEYVRVLGFVKDADASSILKNSVALINPSLSEGFGLQGLEAISSGTMVLCSDIPIFREIYGENATYFDPLDSVDIARKMERALELPAGERGRKISIARKFISKYSWSKMARETLAVYTESVKK